MNDTKSGASAPEELFVEVTGDWNFLAYRSERKYDLHGNTELKVKYIEFSAHQKALDEIERLKKMLEYERQREFPTQSQRDLEQGLENARLKALLVECKTKFEEIESVRFADHSCRETKECSDIAAGAIEKLQKELEGEHER